MKILTELRPCFDGLAGIPQEARILFSALHELPDIDVTGLLNHPAKRLARGTPRNIPFLDTPARRYNRVARLIVSSEDTPTETWLDRAITKSERTREITSLVSSTLTGRSIRPRIIASEKFGDYLWQRLFAKGLASSEFELVRSAEYASIRPSWLGMHSMGALHRYPRMNTTGYDAFIAHTPWPSRVNRGTQLIIRYHDAIPIFYPHQIKRPTMHHGHHASALRSNTKRALFVCTSEATRQDLVSLYPQVEERTAVIPTCVSADLWPKPVGDETLTEIIRSRMTGGGRNPHREGQQFRYLLMVSTIEPRKNHLRLLDAWNRVRRESDPHLKLVIVGSLGWNHGPIVQRMRKFQQQGHLYHLSDVPIEELRSLYSNSTAVVCPSVAEGFDLSGIEAMSCGAVVLASDLNVHREVYGDAAEYFDAYSTDDLVYRINEVLYMSNIASQRADIIERGLERADEYDRSETSERWRVLLDEVASGRYAIKKS